MRFLSPGGVFHDCLVHDIDMICWVLGEYPTHVYAAASSFIGEIGEMGDVDTVAATMKFKSGALAIIDTSRDAKYGYDQRLEVRIAGDVSVTISRVSHPPYFWDPPVL